jgi:hypothetical protein
MRRVGREISHGRMSLSRRNPAIQRKNIRAVNAFVEQINSRRPRLCVEVQKRRSFLSLVIWRRKLHCPELHLSVSKEPRMIMLSESYGFSVLFEEKRGG